jgi:RNA polymerase sigma-70 factor (ECF subfamily)
MMLFTAIREQSAPAVDRQALFESLMRTSHKRAYTLAYRLTGNAAEAEDLVQESFVRAFRFFHRYDDGLPFTSWLYRIMTNAHIDQVRRKGKIRTTSLEQAGSDGLSNWEIADASSSADREMMQGAVSEDVQNALGGMTAEFRTAVLLADVEGMAYEEIAEVMNTSVGTVRSRIHRGRKQIKSHLMKFNPSQYQRLCDEL